MLGSKMFYVRARRWELCKMQTVSPSYACHQKHNSSYGESLLVVGRSGRLQQVDHTYYVWVRNFFTHPLLGVGVKKYVLVAFVRAKQPRESRTLLCEAKVPSISLTLTRVANPTFNATLTLLQLNACNSTYATQPMQRYKQLDLTCNRKRNRGAPRLRHQNFTREHEKSYTQKTWKKVKKTWKKVKKMGGGINSGLGGVF